MSTTDRYLERQEHQCDVCGKCVDLERTTRIDSIPITAPGWYRLGIGIQAQALTESTVEFCEDCQLQQPWHGVLEALRTLIK
jgi:hypothetical protein